MRSRFFIRLLAVFLLCALTPASRACLAQERIPVLLYHRFGPVVADSMTVTTPVFESHLRYLKENGYRFITVAELVTAHAARTLGALGKAVVLVSDDAHISVFKEAYPLVRQYGAKMTVFSYPSAVSNASYAMTWAQLRELEQSGLFNVQSHTFWHPNFKIEKKRLTAPEYEKLVRTQFVRARERLAHEMGHPVTYLAWPFGIFDDELAGWAAQSGYAAAFTIEPYPVTQNDKPYALPRFLLNDADRNGRFVQILQKPGKGN